MSRRKPEKKPGLPGSIFSAAIDVKPGIVFPGSVKRTAVLNTMPLGLYLDEVDGEFYFYVDIYYGLADKDEQRYVEQEDGQLIRISVHRVLDATERKEVARKTMARLLSAVQRVNGEIYLMTNTIEKNKYQCGFPRASTYDITISMVAGHTPFDPVVWDDQIFPALWNDTFLVNQGDGFQYPGEAPTYKWQKTGDTPFQNGIRLKVTRQKFS